MHHVLATFGLRQLPSRGADRDGESHFRSGRPAELIDLVRTGVLWILCLSSTAGRTGPARNLTCLPGPTSTSSATNPRTCCTPSGDPDATARIGTMPPVAHPLVSAARNRPRLRVRQLAQCRYHACRGLRLTWVAGGIHDLAPPTKRRRQSTSTAQSRAELMLTAGRYLPPDWTTPVVWVPSRYRCTRSWGADGSSVMSALNVCRSTAALPFRSPAWWSACLDLPADSGQQVAQAVHELPGGGVGRQLLGEAVDVAVVRNPAGA